MIDPYDRVVVFVSATPFRGVLVDASDVDAAMRMPGYGLPHAATSDVSMTEDATDGSPGAIHAGVKSDSQLEWSIADHQGENGDLTVTAAGLAPLPEPRQTPEHQNELVAHNDAWNGSRRKLSTHRINDCHVSQTLHAIPVVESHVIKSLVADVLHAVPTSDVSATRAAEQAVAVRHAHDSAPRRRRTWSDETNDKLRSVARMLVIIHRFKTIGHQQVGHHEAKGVLIPPQARQTSVRKTAIRIAAAADRSNTKSMDEYIREQTNLFKYTGE